MYEFSGSWFFIGLLILGAGIAFVRYYQWVADNFGGGVGSYERYRFFAILTCVIGLIAMANLHSLLLIWVFSLIFGS